MGLIGRNRYGVSIVLIGISLSVSGIADDIPYAACFGEASGRYRVDVRLLIAIAKVESDFDMNAVNVNDNGSRDYGIMQINSIWKDDLSSLGIDWHQVISSPCLNIQIGAWILAHNFSLGGVSWNSVGAYNVGFGDSGKAQSRRVRYASNVYRAYKELDANSLYRWSIMRTYPSIWGAEIQDDN